METSVQQEADHTLSLSRQDIYAKSVVVPIDHEADMQLMIPVEDHVQEPVPPLYEIRQEPLQQNQRRIPKGEDQSRCLLADGSPHVNNAMESSRGSMQTPNCHTQKFYSSSFPSKFCFWGCKVDSHMGNCKEHYHKKKRKHSHFTSTRKLTQNPWLQHDTCMRSEPWTLPTTTLTFQQQQNHCICEKYSQFQARITRLAKPASSSVTKPQSQSMDSDAQMYIKALEGQELDVQRGYDRGIPPVNEVWPFLLRFPIGCVSICLGLGSQTILWKGLSTAHSMQFTHIPKHINLVLWFFALIIAFIVFTIYCLKCLFHAEAVRREFFHPVRINFFFAPSIACMLLTMGTPPALGTTIHPFLWVFFMGPIFALELKIYGQWLIGGKRRRLCMIVNPAMHLCLLGNFVGALLAATIGWREVAIFLWTVGFAHYLAVWATLYQRLPQTILLPKELRPIYFLFVAAPSTASVAWSQIAGHFDMISRFCYFVALFLYLSLVVRINFFRGFRFSMTWWAYAYPVTTFANATIHYSLEVEHPFTQGLAALFALIACITVFSLSLTTMLHISRGTMFPNDVGIVFIDQKQPATCHASDTPILPLDLKQGKHLKNGVDQGAPQ